MAEYENVTISLATFQRMPRYLRFLKERQEEGQEYISSVGIADALFLNAALVKKDLSQAIISEGKPKVGYAIPDLISDIEEFLGYNNTKDAILVGAGKLGQALMEYKGFEKYGLNIILGFDIREDIVGKEIGGKKILPIQKLDALVKKLDIKMGILTIPQESAQLTADTLVKAGIKAIWNFTPAHITVPDNVALKNENMAASLAVLSNQLRDILKKEESLAKKQQAKKQVSGDLL